MILLTPFKRKILSKIEEKLMFNYFSNDEFIDFLIDEGGKYLKILGNQLIEYLKKKYMIGSYSRNYKNRINSYKQGRNLYNTCVNLYYQILTDNTLNKGVVNSYVKNCNKLNMLCYNFKDEMPFLDYKNPEKAISNFEEIENYINMLTTRLSISKI